MRAPAALLAALTACAHAPPPATPTPAAAATSPIAAARPSPAGVLLLPDSELFMGTVEVETSSALAIDELLLRTRYAGTFLGELEPRHLLVRRIPGELLLRLPPSYPAPDTPPSEQDRRCSFLIDCDDSSVAQLIDTLRGEQHTSARDVIDYVHDFMSAKRLSRSFDIASTVARNREGDCTEHAVLTAALLRGVGIPARVTLGLVLLDIDGHRAAFGHAWAEQHDGTRWQLADATKIDTKTEGALYVPLRTIIEEGAGFSREMFSGLQTVDVESVGVPAAR